MDRLPDTTKTTNAFVKYISVHTTSELFSAKTVQNRVKLVRPDDTHFTQRGNGATIALDERLSGGKVLPSTCMYLVLMTTSNDL